MARSWPLIILSLLTGSIYVMLGIMMLFGERINKDFHKQLLTDFGRHATVFPFAGLLGWRPTAIQYMQGVGVIELTCGLIHALMSGSLKMVANVSLMVVMVGAVYSHWALNDEPAKMIPAFVCFTLLACCLFLQASSSGRGGKQKAN